PPSAVALARAAGVRLELAARRDQSALPGGRGRSAALDRPARALSALVRALLRERPLVLPQLVRARAPPHAHRARAVVGDGRARRGALCAAGRVARALRLLHVLPRRARGA